MASPRVLIVEDNEGEVRKIREALLDNGIEEENITIVSDLVAAVQVAVLDGIGKFEGIVLDGSLARINYETTSREIIALIMSAYGNARKHPQLAGMSVQNEGALLLYMMYRKIEEEGKNLPLALLLNSGSDELIGHMITIANTMGANISVPPIDPSDSRLRQKSNPATIVEFVENL